MFPRFCNLRNGCGLQSRRTTTRASVSASSRRFTHDDPTLVWARENPEQAQRCLQPPVWDLDACDISFSDQKSESFDGYCQWRRWPNAGPDEDAFLREKTLAISSHVLSAPITLANFTSRKGCPVDSHFCCVGARAEATIPFDLWKEYLLLSSATNGSPVATTLDFVGPDIVATPGKTPDQEVKLESGSSLLLKWRFEGLLHDLLSKNESTGTTDAWDGFVFFNPGFGHPNLKDDWHYTLEKVLPLGLPLLLTAHSELDARRDAKHLKEDFGLKIEYEQNPFASRISYQDPFHKDHRVRPNHYVAHVSFQT
jgi:hypothetical protein